MLIDNAIKELSEESQNIFRFKYNSGPKIDANFGNYVDVPNQDGSGTKYRCYIMVIKYADMKSTNVSIQDYFNNNRQLLKKQTTSKNYDESKFLIRVKYTDLINAGQKVSDVNSKTFALRDRTKQLVSDSSFAGVCAKAFANKRTIKFDSKNPTNSPQIIRTLW